MTRKLLLLLAALVALAASAKEPQFILRGTVTMADTTAWVPLDSVHVSLSSATGQDVAFKLLTGNDSTKIIDDNGEMRLLVNGGQGKYLLTLDREGYDPLMRDVELKFKNQNVLWVGSMQMHREKSLELKEVEVVGTAIKLVVKGDTLVYNANAFNLAEGSMLDALIKQLDGVELTSDGQITVNGRTVNSLLINGKDFFKGDPQVALENLPAYSVSNVKVYDKAADDDYLSQASAKLARREDEENLVMDVVLKKEFNIGYMGSIEAGYGTQNRWLGKGFGLGFTDKWRLSAYVNANNVNDNERAGTGGNWNSRGGGGSGETTRESGGLDYMYDHKKLRVNGNVTYNHSDAISRSQNASTRYYPSGNIYNRSSDWGNTVINAISTSHELKQRWDAVYFGADWKLNWNRTDRQARNRQATFNSLPQEQTRTEALDSVFEYTPSERYDRILLSRLATADVSRPGSFSTSGELEATVRTSNMRGRVNAEVSGGYSSSQNDVHKLYLQHFGGANTSSAIPTNSDRFSSDDSHSWNLNTSANYTWDWSKIHAEKWQNHITLRSRMGFYHKSSHSDYDLFLADGSLSSSSLVLPSLLRPENAIQNLSDSYRSTKQDNNGSARATLNFSRELIAPSPAGINPGFGISASVVYNLNNERLEYHVLSSQPELLRRTKGHLTETIGFRFFSNNDYRYWQLALNYSNSASDPSLNLFLRNRTNTNPLHVYENNAGELKSAWSNTMRLNLFRSGRKVHNQFSADFTWSQTDNSVGQWSYYNKETGITTYRPMNINGNWNTRGNISYSHPLGRREQLILSGYATASYNHSVDFQSTEAATPERSLVRNTNVAGSLRVTYKFKNGSNISLYGGPSWQYATSEREKFNTVDAMTYSAGLDGVAELPWDIQLRSDLNFQARRGYEEASMNTTRWLWNATVTKSILSGNLLFKLGAYDILNQIDPVSYTVNAQGQTEVWTNTLPRYVMLSIAWRFNQGKQPQSRTPRNDRAPKPGGSPAMRMNRLR